MALLLRMDPQQRISAKTALESRYFQEPPLPMLKYVRPCPSILVSNSVVSRDSRYSPLALFLISDRPVSLTATEGSIPSGTPAKIRLKMPAKLAGKAQKA